MRMLLYNYIELRKGGKMVKRAAGGLKPVPEGNKGLGKLPQPVRNKMGFMKKGGMPTKNFGNVDLRANKGMLVVSIDMIKKRKDDNAKY